MSVIGIVRLAPGQVGYFDDLTRIHLTIASPEKPVVSGMNTTNLKRAVKSGRILLASGSLDVTAKAPAQAQAPVTTPAQEVKVEAQTQLPAETDEIKEESGTITIDTEVALQKIQEEKEDEAPVVEEPAVEETVIEETTEEVVTEETVVEETVVATEEAEIEAEDAEEVVEETTETAETEVKAAAKKGSTKKK